jgi:biopolymer transport protein TolQ
VNACLGDGQCRGGRGGISGRPPELSGDGGFGGAFVGLFGTVWGIMNSFFQIGQQQNSSLSVVAPGISEALFATAIGLFAAIPAVIGYNRYSHVVNGFESRLQRFADRFHASLSRELDGL